MPNSVISKLTIPNSSGTMASYDIKDAEARQQLASTESVFIIHATGQDVSGTMTYTVSETYTAINSAYSAGKSLILHIIEGDDIYVLKNYMYGEITEDLDAFIFTSDIVLISPSIYSYYLYDNNGTATLIKINQVIKSINANSNSAVEIGGDNNEAWFDVKVDGTTITKNGTTGVLSAVGGGGGGQVNSDWNATSGVAQILNKPGTVPMVVTFTNNTTQTYNVYISN